MYLKQGDLFWGMDKDFVKQVMNESEKNTYNEGETLFLENEPADHFYILLKGRIKLSAGDEGHTVYVATDPGHVIGWSTLLGRKTYSAAAKAMESATLVKIEKNSFLNKLKNAPEGEAILFKRIAKMLGDRLIAVYPSIP